MIVFAFLADLPLEWAGHSPISTSFGPSDESRSANGDRAVDTAETACADFV